MGCTRKNNHPQGRECVINGQMKFLNFMLCTGITCHKINIVKVNTVYMIIEIDSYKQSVGRVVVDVVYSPKSLFCIDCMLLLSTPGPPINPCPRAVPG